MKTVTVPARIREPDSSIEVTIELPEDIDEMIQEYGAQETYDAACASVVIDLQATMRRGLRSEKSSAQIRQELVDWKPGTRVTTRKTKAEKVRALWDDMSDADKQALLGYLKSDEDENEEVAA